MAFKLNYDLLANRDAYEKTAEEYRKRQESLVAERIEKVEALKDAPGLTAWETKFVADMDYFATTFEMGGGIQGSRLGTLSEKQVATLDALFERVAPAAPKP
jgi:hypothetical protein